MQILTNQKFASLFKIFRFYLFTLKKCLCLVSKQQTEAAKPAHCEHCAVEISFFIPAVFCRGKKSANDGWRFCGKQLVDWMTERGRQTRAGSLLFLGSRSQK